MQGLQMSSALAGVGKLPPVAPGDLAFFQSQQLHAGLEHSGMGSQLWDSGLQE